jgi:hypothetical protein
MNSVAPYAYVRDLIRVRLHVFFHRLGTDGSSRVLIAGRQLPLICDGQRHAVLPEGDGADFKAVCCPFRRCRQSLISAEFCLILCGGSQVFRGSSAMFTSGDAVLREAPAVVIWGQPSGTE